MHSLKGKKELLGKHAEEEESDDDTDDSDVDQEMGEEDDSDEEEDDESDDGEEEEESDDSEETPAGMQNNRKQGKDAKLEKLIQMAGGSDDDDSDESDDDDSDESDDEDSDESDDDEVEAPSAKVPKDKGMASEKAKQLLAEGLESGDLFDSDDENFAIGDDVEADSDDSEDSDEEEESDDDSEDDESSEEPTSKIEKQAGKGVLLAAKGKQIGKQQQKVKQQQPQQKDEKPKPKAAFDTPITDVRAKYEKQKGKTLYLRFPSQLPADHNQTETDVKQLNPRIITVRRPRQKSTRFCLVDFANQQDRDKAFKELQTVQVAGKRLHVQIPRTESDEFVDKIVERRKMKSVEKLAKKKLAKSADKPKKELTSTIKVSNIPVHATADEVKKHFPGAVDFRILFARGTQQTNSAIVTLPTTHEATMAYRKRVEIGENKLSVKFAINKFPPKSKMSSPQSKEPKTGKPQKEKREAIGISQNFQPDGKKMKQKQQKKKADGAEKKPIEGNKKGKPLPANAGQQKQQIGGKQKKQSNASPQKQQIASPEKQPTNSIVAKPQNNQPNSNQQQQQTKKNKKNQNKPGNQQNQMNQQNQKPKLLNQQSNGSPSNEKKRKISTGEDADVGTVPAKKQKPQNSQPPVKPHNKKQQSPQQKAPGGQPKKEFNKKPYQVENRQQSNKRPFQPKPNNNPKFGNKGPGGAASNKPKFASGKPPFNKNNNRKFEKGKKGGPGNKQFNKKGMKSS